MSKPLLTVPNLGTSSGATAIILSLIIGASATAYVILYEASFDPTTLNNTEIFGSIFLLASALVLNLGLIAYTDQIKSNTETALSDLYKEMAAEVEIPNVDISYDITEQVNKLISEIGNEEHNPERGS